MTESTRFKQEAERKIPYFKTDQVLHDQIIWLQSWGNLQLPIDVETGSPYTVSDFVAYVQDPENRASLQQREPAFAQEFHSRIRLMFEYRHTVRKHLERILEQPENYIWPEYLEKGFWEGWRPNQVEHLESIIDCLKKGYFHLASEVATGAGKTMVLAAFVRAQIEAIHELELKDMVQVVLCTSRTNLITQFVRNPKFFQADIKRIDKILSGDQNLQRAAKTDGIDEEEYPNDEDKLGWYRARKARLEQMTYDVVHADEDDSPGDMRLLLDGAIDDSQVRVLGERVSTKEKRKDALLTIMTYARASRSKLRDLFGRRRVIGVILDEAHRLTKKAALNLEAADDGCIRYGVSGTLVGPAKRSPFPFFQRVKRVFRRLTQKEKKDIPYQETLAFHKPAWELIQSGELPNVRLIQAKLDVNLDEIPDAKNSFDEAAIYRHLLRNLSEVQKFIEDVFDTQDQLLMDQGLLSLKKRKIYIFVRGIHLANQIADFLNKTYADDGIYAAAVSSGDSADEVRDKKEQFRENEFSVLVSPFKLAEGDDEQPSVVMHLHPHSPDAMWQLIQEIGRALHNSEIEPILIQPHYGGMKDIATVQRAFGKLCVPNGGIVAGSREMELEQKIKWLLRDGVEFEMIPGHLNATELSLCDQLGISFGTHWKGGKNTRKGERFTGIEVEDVEYVYGTPGSQDNHAHLRGITESDLEEIDPDTLSDRHKQAYRDVCICHSNYFEVAKNMGIDPSEVMQLVDEAVEILVIVYNIENVEVLRGMTFMQLKKAYELGHTQVVLAFARAIKTPLRKKLALEYGSFDLPLSRIEEAMSEKIIADCYTQDELLRVVGEQVERNYFESYGEEICAPEDIPESVLCEKWREIFVAVYVEKRPTREVAREHDTSELGLGTLLRKIRPRLVHYALRADTESLDTFTIPQLLHRIKAGCEEAEEVFRTKFEPEIAPKVEREFFGRTEGELAEFVPIATQHITQMVITQQKSSPEGLFPQKNIPIDSLFNRMWKQLQICRTWPRRSHKFVHEVGIEVFDQFLADCYNPRMQEALRALIIDRNSLQHASDITSMNIQALGSVIDGMAKRFEIWEQQGSDLSNLENEPIEELITRYRHGEDRLSEHIQQWATSQSREMLGTLCQNADLIARASQRCGREFVRLNREHDPATRNAYSFCREDVFRWLREEFFDQVSEEVVKDLRGETLGSGDKEAWLRKHKGESSDFLRRTRTDAPSESIDKMIFDLLMMRDGEPVSPEDDAGMIRRMREKCPIAQAAFAEKHGPYIVEALTESNPDVEIKNPENHIRFAVGHLQQKNARTRYGIDLAKHPLYSVLREQTTFYRGDAETGFLTRNNLTEEEFMELDFLTPEEKQVFVHMYYDNAPKSHLEYDMGISIGRVSELEGEAVRRMEHYHKAQTITDEELEALSTGEKAHLIRSGMTRANEFLEQSIHREALEYLESQIADGAVRDEMVQVVCDQYFEIISTRHYMPSFSAKNSLDPLIQTHRLKSVSLEIVESIPEEILPQKWKEFFILRHFEKKDDSSIKRRLYIGTKREFEKVYQQAYRRVELYLIRDDAYGVESLDIDELLERMRAGSSNATEVFCDKYLDGDNSKLEQFQEVHMSKGAAMCEYQFEDWKSRTFERRTW